MFLLKLEWLKFRRNTTVRVLLALYVVLLPTAWSAQSMPGHGPEAMVQFPAVWSFVGYVGNWLSFLLLGFLGVYVFTYEFANRMLRQNVLTGLHRRQVYLAKWQFLLLLALAATLYYAVTCLLVGFIYTDATEIGLAWQRLYMVPRYLLMCLGYMSLGVLCALLIRRTAVAVFLYFGYVLLFEWLFRWVVHQKVVDNVTMHFYPANAFEDLVPLPLTDFALAQQFIDENASSIFLSPTQAVIASTIYLTLFVWGGHYLLQSRDL